MEKITIKSRENAENKGFMGNRAICVCGNHGTFSSIAHKVSTFNGYSYICPDCYKNAVTETKGIFTTALVEKRAKKDASHGVRVSMEIDGTKLTEEQKGSIVASLAVDRIATLYVSTAKIGTWQLSKVSDFIGKDKIKALASKDGYTLKADPDTVIKAVRDISSNHGKLSERIIKEYGFKKA